MTSSREIERAKLRGPRHFRKHGYLVSQIAVVVFLIVSAVYVPAQNAVQRATRVRIEMQGIYGPLFIKIAGREKKITDQAQQAWIINRGRHVVYSSSEGAGGFENEGQSLHLYDVDTGNHKQIMSEYFMVDTVKEVVTSKKKRALLVAMSDGGLLVLTHNNATSPNSLRFSTSLECYIVNGRVTTREFMI